MHPETHVQFTKITTLDPTLVQQAITLAHYVATSNGNRYGPDKPILLVTDDLDEIVKMSPFARVTKKTRKYLGVTWHKGGGFQRGSLIWLNPEAYRSHSALLDTFIHELAHAMTKAGHGWTWRRMYVLLLAFIGPIFNERSRILEKTDGVIRTYQRWGTTERSTDNYDSVIYDATLRRIEERDKHIDALRRLIKRLDPALLETVDWS